MTGEKINFRCDHANLILQLTNSITKNYAKGHFTVVLNKMYRSLSHFHRKDSLIPV